jgi:alginate O-acetyltransferase complex protein AlgI
MTVPSWQFLVFVVAGAILFNLSRRHLWQDSIWLALNLTFIWSFSESVASLLPFTGFLGLGYFAQAAARNRPQLAGAAAISLILCAFIWLKRYSFVPQSALLPTGYLTIGLSYVFFRVMHLVIDAAQGGTRPIGVLPYLNYTLNFPAFISGPIQRREDYEASANLPLDIGDIGTSAWRMVLGAFKVIILSAALHTWQHSLIEGLAATSNVMERAVDGSLIVVLYALFLYANFSGYTDFVIGVARLFRLRLPENFDRPFAAVNFIEFWSRWHITLSQWLRSYVFNPLLMNWMRRSKTARSKQYPAIVAFFVTFFLVGAWHGQTTEFLFFGLLQGGGVAGNRLYQVWMARWLGRPGYSRLGANPLYKAVSRGLTFTWFSFTLLWFWASWSQITLFAERLGGTGIGVAAVGTVAASSIVLAIPDMAGPAGAWIAAGARSRYTRTSASAAMVLAMMIAALVLNLSSPEIVYKQF